jgi:hypothetical protein
MTKTLRPCAPLLIAALLLSLSACGNNKRFDSAAWLKSDARERGRMAEDLVRQGILIGKSVEETQRLIGAPDKEYGQVLSYKIDLGWIFKDQKHYGLQVHLDSGRYVREVKIVD